MDKDRRLAPIAMHMSRTDFGARLTRIACMPHRYSCADEWAGDYMLSLNVKVCWRADYPVDCKDA